MTQRLLTKGAFVSDKDGDMHYDVMSAFQNQLEVVMSMQHSTT